MSNLKLNQIVPASDSSAPTVITAGSHPASPWTTQPAPGANEPPAPLLARSSTAQLLHATNLKHLRASEVNERLARCDFEYLSPTRRDAWRKELFKRMPNIAAADADRLVVLNEAYQDPPTHRLMVDCTFNKAMGGGERRSRSHPGVAVLRFLLTLPFRLMVYVLFLMSVSLKSLFLFFCRGPLGPMDELLLQRITEFSAWGWHHEKHDEYCTRSMILHRVHNLRDLGGLPTTDGKVTRSGVFFRSAKPDEATPEDLQALRDTLHVQTIMDLRNLNSHQRKQLATGKAEVMPIDAVYAWDLADDPHAHAGDVRRLPVRFLNHAVSSKMAAWLWRRGFEWCRFPLGILSFWWMDRYVDMLFLLRALHLADTIFYQWMLRDFFLVTEWGRDRLAAIFVDENLVPINMPVLYMYMLEHCHEELRAALEHAADQRNRPMLFHCEHGKDRTGIIAALILLCARVSKEHIKKDYHESEKFTRGTQYLLEHEVKDHPPACLGPLGLSLMSNRTVYEMCAAHPESFMEQALGYIDKCGGPDKYFDMIGFSKEKRAQIRAALVGDPADAV